MSLLLLPEASLPESIHLPCLFHGAPKMTSNGMLMYRGSHSVQASGSPPLQLFVKNLSASPIVMMEPTQDWEGEDLATCRIWWHGSSFLLRNLLSDPLMRSCLVEVDDIRTQDAVELLLMQDEQMIKALSPDTAEEPLADRIGSGSVIRGSGDFNVARCCDSGERGSKFVLVIPDGVLRSRAKGSGFPKRYVRSKHRWESVSYRCGSLCESAVRQ